MKTFTSSRDIVTYDRKQGKCIENFVKKASLFLNLYKKSGDPWTNYQQFKPLP